MTMSGQKNATLPMKWKGWRTMPDRTSIQFTTPVSMDSIEMTIPP